MSKDLFEKASLHSSKKENKDVLWMLSFNFK